MNNCHIVTSYDSPEGIAFVEIAW